MLLWQVLEFRNQRRILAGHPHQPEMDPRYSPVSMHLNLNWARHCAEAKGPNMAFMPSLNSQLP